MFQNDRSFPACVASDPKLVALRCCSVAAHPAIHEQQDREASARSADCFEITTPWKTRRNTGLKAYKTGTTPGRPPRLSRHVPQQRRGSRPHQCPFELRFELRRSRAA